MQLIGIGSHRIVYRAVGFSLGLVVTAYVWSPDGVRSALLSLTELEEGLYYLDYDFPTCGLYISTFYEGGAPTGFQTLRVGQANELVKLDGVRLLIDLPFSIREGILRGYLTA